MAFKNRRSQIEVAEGVRFELAILLKLKAALPVIIGTALGTQLLGKGKHKLVQTLAHAAEWADEIRLFGSKRDEQERGHSISRPVP